MSRVDRAAILAMIPHQGAMCLWDAVDSWDAGTVAVRSASHRDPGNPLRSDGRLRALHLCEYGAQAMAVHGGLRARDSGAPVRPGMLVALRGMQLHVARIDDLAGDIECVAEVLVEAGDSQQYAFRIECDGLLLAEGRAAVMLGAEQPAL
ncbi:phosphotransferase [Luteimonas sp. WGS1318]|uniref:phosphotransferase n=1 Tax=Luteimonas sp. WGS1318 TaxID=3366815 RepID=UPI00372D29D2